MSYDAENVASGAIDSYQALQPGKSRLHLTRLDTVQRIMAGTFTGELTSPVTGKKVQVTDGQFDIGC